MDCDFLDIEISFFNRCLQEPIRFHIFTGKYSMNQMDQSMEQ